MSIRESVSGWPVSAFRRYRAWVFVGLFASLLVPAAIAGRFVTYYVIPESYNYRDPHDREKGLIDFGWRSSDTYCTPNVPAAVFLFSLIFLGLTIPTVAVYATLALGALVVVAELEERRPVPEMEAQDQSLREADRSRGDRESGQ